MNTDALARNYAALTPWERVASIVAASARGDETESTRLARSAPMHYWQIADYCGVAEALRGMVVHYLLEQLDQAALLWEASAVLSESQGSVAGDHDLTARHELLSEGVRLLAHRFVARVEGFQICCAELHVDGESLLRLLPGYPRIRSAEEVARAMAFTAEEARAYLGQLLEATQRLGIEHLPSLAEVAIDTPADIAAAMRARLEERTMEWS